VKRRIQTLSVQKTRNNHSLSRSVRLRKHLKLFKYSVYHPCHLSAALSLTRNELTLILAILVTMHLLRLTIE